MRRKGKLAVPVLDNRETAMLRPATVFRHQAAPKA